MNMIHKLWNFETNLWLHVFDLLNCTTKACWKYNSYYFWKWRLKIKLINCQKVITDADDDAGRDTEVKTVVGDELDSLAKAALDCIGRVIFLKHNQSMKYLSKIYFFINNSFELWGDCTWTQGVFNVPEIWFVF